MNLFFYNIGSYYTILWKSFQCDKRKKQDEISSCFFKSLKVHINVALEHTVVEFSTLVSSS